MDAVERVQCVLEGRKPDRPPLGFWYHFSAEQASGPAAVRAHLNHLDTYGLDFLKVMNENGYPHGPERITRVEDLAAIPELRGDEPEFARQLDLIASLKRELRGRVLMTTTVFNAWAELRHLVRPPTEHHPPDMQGEHDAPSRLIREFVAQDADAVSGALGRMGATIARFAKRCIVAGADGIYLSVRDDWLDAADRMPRRYGEIVRASDLAILAAVSAARFNVLHICGSAVDFRAFADYPVHIVHWADRSAGPSIAKAKGWVRSALCAGLDNLKTLPDGTPADCEREVADALRQAGARPMLIAPGCTYDPARVPRENLEAVCRTVRSCNYAA